MAFSSGFETTEG